VKLPEEIEIFRKFGWKNQHFLTRIHDFQISNQIDAAALYLVVYKLLLEL